MSPAEDLSLGIVTYLALFAAVGILFLFVNLLLGRFLRASNRKRKSWQSTSAASRRLVRRSYNSICDFTSWPCCSSSSTWKSLSSSRGRRSSANRCTWPTSDWSWSNRSPRNSPGRRSDCTANWVSSIPFRPRRNSGQLDRSDCFVGAELQPGSSKPVPGNWRGSRSSTSGCSSPCCWWALPTCGGEAIWIGSERSVASGRNVRRPRRRGET